MRQMDIRVANTLERAPQRAQFPSLAGSHGRVGRLAWIGGGLLLLVALGWYLFAPAHTAKPTATPPPPVRAATIQEKNVTGFERTLGTVVPVATVQITAQVTGQLMTAAFREGQIVHAGDLLFQIDPKPFAAALTQARAALSRDQASALSAEHDRARFTALAAQGAASAQQRDQAIAAANSDEATLQSDRAAVQVAQLNLGYATIRSPITGKTGPILIQPGNLITANNTASPLVTITQIEPIKVSVFLPQADLPRIEAEMAARTMTMSVNPGAGPPLAAAIDFVGNQVDAKTGTVELRATFANTDHRLVPGQYVDAGAALADYSHALVVPRDAVNIGPANRYVFVIDGSDRAHLVPVTVVYDDGVNATIQGNVKAGQRVVVEGQLRVLPDHPVQVLSSPLPGGRGGK
jgi:multidrug efflux system membrane fusion protein